MILHRLTRLIPFLGTVCASLLGATSPGTADLPPAHSLPPRLVVLISLDQFRADYLERFQEGFCDSGFRRLLARGDWYSDCRLRHALTATAPGHASIATGLYASYHGIIANEWALDDRGTMTGAVDDPSTHRLGGREAKAPSLSPHHLKSLTVGDRLRNRHPQAKVIALANKDRAAILMGGRKANAAYWLEDSNFVTSDYYVSSLPGWVDAFNRRDLVNKSFGQTWDRLLGTELYDRLQGPDSPEGKENKLGLGTRFPRLLTGGLPAPGKDFYAAYRLAPHSSELLTSFALDAVKGEALGQDGIPDLLCLGYSQTDYCGHAYGPDSHEIMDSVLRLDRSLARLLQGLDAQVGPDNYAVLLSSDHGVTPLPERHKRLHPKSTAGRFDQEGLERHLQNWMTERLGAPLQGKPWAFRSAHGYHLRMDAVPRALPRDEALAQLRLALEAWPQFIAIYSRDEILRRPENDTQPDFLARIRLGYHPERSQDFVFVLHPFIVDRTPAGTNHGSPYPCDDHVPLLVSAHGLQARVWPERVHTDDIAPTLLHLLGLPPATELTGRNLLER